MTTQHGIRLAVHIIESDFGELVSKVCECLLLKGSVTLNQIVTHTGLPRPDIKRCLLVLIQHNCVQPFHLESKGGFGEQSSVAMQYTSLVSNIIHRLRFPKFLHVVREKLGKECAEVLQGLFEHGRLTLEQIIKRAESAKSAASDATPDIFKRLVSARFVERCPDSDPSIDLPTDEETTTKNRRSKFAKVIPQTIEQRAISSSIPMEAKRFLVSYSTTSDDPAASEKDDPSGLSSGDKRKRDFSEIDDEQEAAHFQKEVLWRPNFEEFVRCLRHKACIVHEKSRLDESAGTVLSAMLECSGNPEGRFVTTHSVPLSLNAIYEEVTRSEVGRTMTLDHVRSSLEQLGCKKDADDLYTVDVDNIIQLCRNAEVESFMLNRYGRIAYMIIRLLSRESRFYETSKIAQIVLTDPSETQNILIQMWKDNYLSMEKISTPMPKSMHYLLWKVNKGDVWKQVVDLMYLAALNLMVRMSFEFNKEPELMELPRSRINGVLANKRTHLRNIKYCLEASLMRLVDAIMLFQDF